MGGTVNPVNGASASSPQPAPESAEVVEARAKSSAAGYARNRAEASYNAAKKEHGEQSSEAQAAKKALDEAQAEVEKRQGELREALQLNAKKSTPPKAKPSGPKTSDKSPPEEGPKFRLPAEQPKGASIIEHRVQVYEFLEIFPKDQGKLRKQLEKALQELKVDPKNLEYYKRQLNNGELLKRLEPETRGEMMMKARPAKVNEARPMAPREER